MASSHQSPNVVLVVADTTRMRDVDRETAPTLVELAEAGTGYEHAYASAPWTLPSHASLFTGVYTNAHGAHGGHTSLDDSHRTLAEVFADAGYATGGVSNNTWVTEEFGFDRGFETFREMEPDRETESSSDARQGSFPETRDADDGAMRSVEWAADWVDGESRPFFLFANFIEPHLEYRPPREYAAAFLPEGWSYEDASDLPQSPREYDVGEFDLSPDEFEALCGLYRAEIAYLDERIADLRRALVEVGAWEETVFVVVGDHGENVGDHGFLGHQYCAYDTLLHVPLVVSGGSFDGGGWTDRLVQQVDLVPTLLDAAGVDDSVARRQFDGRSFHPERGDSPREYAFAEYVQPQPSVETLAERFDGVPEELYDYDRGVRTVRSHEYKLIARTDETRELYHVADDPNETRDIAAANPERVADLERVLESRLGSFDDIAHLDTVDGRTAVNPETESRLRDLGYL